MRLINETQWPPGGWAFTNPVNNWRAPGAHEHDLDGQVRNIISHRRANKLGQPTEFQVVRQEMVEYTCQRLIRDLPATEWKNWVSMANPTDVRSIKKNTPLKSPPPMPPEQKRGAVATLAARLAGLPSGLKTIADWVGEGCVPVDQAQAEQRAKICAIGFNGSKCPMNEDSSFFDLFTGPIAESIKRYSEVKNHLKLNTSEDLNIGVCGMCGCHLKTKVWVPVATIRKRDAKSFIRQPPDHCWIKNEP